MPKKTPHPHIAWRDGRPRFSPGPELRAAGHKGRDLRHEDGRWYSRGECVDWSEAFVKSLAEASTAKSAAPDRPPRPARSEPQSADSVRAPQSPFYSVADLCADWQRSKKFRRPDDPAEARRLTAAKIVYAQRTIKDVSWKLSVIERFHPVVWGLPVAALEQPTLYGMYDELSDSHGLATARGVLRYLSIALKWGRRAGRHRLADNPASGLGMATPPPRLRFATRQEIAALIAAADRLGHPEMGDMIVLGVWTGQRQGDRLQLTDKGSLNARRVFRQSKTGAIVSVPEAPELTKRLAAAARRRRRADIVNPRIVLDESRWEPFPDDGDRYRKRFAEIRAAAANGVVDREATALAVEEHRRARRNAPPPVVYAVAPCPSLLGDAEAGILPFLEMNLRDTAVTWLALAGCSVPEICAITGHSLQSATQILRHYLALHPDMADTAIQKMVSWYEAGGETEFGV